jgi:hypothetical protein
MNRLNYFLLILVFLVGCTRLQTPTATIATLTKAPKPLVTKSSLTPTLNPEPAWTLPATLSVQDATSKVNELLQTNGGCRLPCWWGITPGQTKWEDARNTLFPLAKSVYDTYNQEGESFPGVLTYYSTDFSRFFEQDYTVNDSIVQAIKIKVPNSSPFSTPKRILEEYGVPDKVYIGGNEYEPDVQNVQYFSVGLYYVKQRIFVYYGGGFQPIQPGPSLVICFPEIDYTELHLWGSAYSFEKTRDAVFQENGNSFHSLEAVTDLTTEEFFKRFTISTEPPCIETPAEKWLP